MTTIPRSALLGVFAASFVLSHTALADDKADCVAASQNAQSLRDDRKLLKAREQFLACARDVCPGAVKKDCADQVAEIDRRTPSVVLRAKDKTGQDLTAVKVTSDGAPFADALDGRAIPIDPGAHTFRFEAGGNEPFEQKVVIAEGEHNRAITVTFGKPEGVVEAPAKKGAPIAAIIVSGVGLAGMGVGAAFWGMGLSDKGSAETTCKPTCPSATVDSIHTKLVVGDVIFFAGTAVLVGGIIWTIVHYASGNKEASAPPAAAFDIGPTQYGRGAVASTTIQW